MSLPVDEIQSVALVIEETSGIPRANEPVTMGVPFSITVLKDPSALSLFDEENHQLPLQTELINLWSDGSVRWLLLDFQVSIDAHTTKVWQLKLQKRELLPASRISFTEMAGALIVDSGIAAFQVALDRLTPINSAQVDGVEMIDPHRSSVILADSSGENCVPIVKQWTIEARGPLRATVFLSGSFENKREKFVDFFSRIHVYAGHSFTKIELTIRNPRAAKHRGGLWDLGDRGSVCFKDLSINVGMIPDKDMLAEWKSKVEDKMNISESHAISIYQDSSGGENWNSRNHINRFGKVTTSFKGYKVYKEDRIIEEGNRANPVLYIGTNQRKVGAAIAGFWQNFPGSLESRGGVLTTGLFSGRFGDLFELQGGEQKTHSFVLSFSKRETSPDINWIYSPIVPKLQPDYYTKADVFGYLTPRERDTHNDYIALMDSIIEGEASFFSRREIIDEYGWRNFGDLYADHENVYYDGPKPLISHYNNQYDALYGFLLHYARSGDQRWFHLADDLARHVIDVDIYHTDRDKAAYNGGLFWHTDHYTDAATSTHRTYSRKTMEAKGLREYGGGPSNEHNYTTGLLYYYFMTGNQMARESVMGLADWVINMDDGAKSPLRFLCRGATGLASRTGTDDYHKPGRGCGNSINTLIDGFILSGDSRYLDKAEELIRRCIHPHDDIDSLNFLTDPEHRWYYTAFLQTLGRYLDFKSEQSEGDYMYCYAREALLHYTGWMTKNEVPSKQMLDRVEYPTETWIVMDMRKSNVFEYAAKYAPEGDLRKQFLEKADFFYNICFKDLSECETKTFIRPLVMLMSYGIMHTGFERLGVSRTAIAGDSDCSKDFALPRRFISQKQKARRTLVIVGASVLVILVIHVLLLLLKVV